MTPRFFASGPALGFVRHFITALIPSEAPESIPSYSELKAFKKREFYVLYVFEMNFYIFKNLLFEKIPSFKKLKYF